MPIYCYRCPDGTIVEEIFPIGHAPATVSAVGVEGRPAVARRDFSAEHPKGKLALGPGWPLHSVAAGLDPSQVPDAMRRFPDHKYAPDGDMIFDNPQHRKKCLRDIGMVDLDGN